MRLSSVVTCLFVSLVVCYASVNCVALTVVDAKVEEKILSSNAIHEDDRRGVVLDPNTNQSEKFRRHTNQKLEATEKQQRFLSPVSGPGLYDSHGFVSGHGGSRPSHFYPSGPVGDHHHQPHYQHHTTGYGSTGHGSDLSLVGGSGGGHSLYYGSSGSGYGAKYPSYDLGTKYGSSGHGYGHSGSGIFGGYGGGHSHAHLKGLLIPLAGIALLGAAAALSTNPVLLQLGVVNGKRRRRSVPDERQLQAIESSINRHRYR